MNKKLHYPKPRKLNQEIVDVSLVDKYRKLDCLFYDHCLDHATEFLYLGFSCRECCYYYKSDRKDDTIKIDPDEFAKMMNGNVE